MLKQVVFSHIDLFMCAVQIYGIAYFTVFFSILEHKIQGYYHQSFQKYHPIQFLQIPAMGTVFKKMKALKPFVGIFFCFFNFGRNAFPLQCPVLDGLVIVVCCVKHWLQFFKMELPYFEICFSICRPYWRAGHPKCPENEAPVITAD